MANVIHYSNNNIFLTGISCGIRICNDSSLTSDTLPEKSNDPEYALMLITEDSDAEEDGLHYYNEI